MNTLEIIEFCKLYYFMCNGHEVNGNDSAIIDCLIHMYNVTELDSTEITELWTTYVKNGSLDFKKAFQKARRR